MRHILLLTLVLATIACQPKKPANTEGIKKELAERELKKVPKSDLMSLGFNLGKAVSHKIDSIIFSKNDIGDCQTGFEIIARENKVRINRYEHGNFPAKPDSIEQVLIDAFTYSVENDLPYGDNLNEYRQDSLIFAHFVKPYDEKATCFPDSAIQIFFIHLPIKTLVESF